MNRVEVSSSSVASVGYDADTCILEVEFRHGGVYQYFDVPAAEYEQLMGAASVGGYLAANIKPTYRYSQV